MLYKLEFFHRSKGTICGDDVKQQEKKARTINLNLNSILLVADIVQFETPFSAKRMGSYSWVEVHDGTCFFMSGEEQIKLLKAYNEWQEKLYPQLLREKIPLEGLDPVQTT